MHISKNFLLELEKCRRQNVNLLEDFFYILWLNKSTLFANTGKSINSISMILFFLRFTSTPLRSIITYFFLVYLPSLFFLSHFSYNDLHIEYFIVCVNKLEIYYFYDDTFYLCFQLCGLNHDSACIIRHRPLPHIGEGLNNVQIIIKS